MEKKICIIYTETTGLHQTTKDVTKKELFNFARLVVLNYEIGYVQDKHFIQEKKVRMIVKPRNMVIPKDTEQFHGITQEYAIENGTDPMEIINIFKSDIKKVNVIVSHNIDFHLKTILAEAVRYNIFVDISKYIIIDTINFYHDYGFLKLEDLATRLKINHEEYDKLDLIIIVFFKLYKKYQKSLK
jgi:hypothetical protein